jgi:small GTP-binding protein
MSDINTFKLKICLVGESAVGKTSLIRRYVLDEFNDKYIDTLGAKVTKKKIMILNPKNKKPSIVDLMIWDIMGQKGFRKLLQESYFNGINGIIGVCDNTRENTLSDLHSWMDAVHSVTEEIPGVFLGNKCDLDEGTEIGLIELRDFASEYEQTMPYLSSAKTGENVELAFKTLSERIIKNRF